MATKNLNAQINFLNTDDALKKLKAIRTEVKGLSDEIRKIQSVKINLGGGFSGGSTSRNSNSKSSFRQSNEDLTKYTERLKLASSLSLQYGRTKDGLIAKFGKESELLKSNTQLLSIQERSSRALSLAQVSLKKAFDSGAISATRYQAELARLDSQKKLLEGKSKGATSASAAKNISTLQSVNQEIQAFNAVSLRLGRSLDVINAKFGAGSPQALKFSKAIKDAGIVQNAAARASDALNKAEKEQLLTDTQLITSKNKLAASIINANNKLSNSTPFRQLNKELFGINDILKALDPRIGSFVDRFSTLRQAFSSANFSPLKGQPAKVAAAGLKLPQGATNRLSVIQGGASGAAELGASEAAITGIGAGATVAAGAVAGLTVGLVGLGAAAAKGVKEFAPLEVQINRFAALNDLNAEQTKAYADTLADLSNRYSEFSQVEIASTLVEISKAGVSATDSIKLIPTAIDFAVASQTDLKTSSEQLIGIQNGFGLAIENSAKSADVLAQAAKDSSIDVSDIALTMSYVAPNARAAGQSLEQMSAITTILGQNLIRGEKAGTALRGILVRLVDPPKEARDALARLGVSIQDTSGNMLPLSRIIDQVREKTKNLSGTQRLQTLSQIAGTEALSAFNVLVNQNTGAIENLTDKYSELNGVNRELADRMRQGLIPAFNELGNTLNNVFVKFGSYVAEATNLAGALRGLSQILRTITNQDIGSQIRNRSVNVANTLVAQGKAVRQKDGTFAISDAGKNAFFGLQRGDTEARLAEANKRVRELNSSRSNKLSDRDVLLGFGSTTSSTKATNKKTNPGLGPAVQAKPSKGKKGPSAETLARREDRTNDLKANLAASEASRAAKQKELEIDQKILDINNQIAEIRNRSEQRKQDLEAREQRFDLASKEIELQKQELEGRVKSGELSRVQAAQEADRIARLEIENQFRKDGLDVETKRIEFEERRDTLAQIRLENAQKELIAQNNLNEITEQIRQKEEQIAKIKDPNNRLKERDELVKLQERQDSLNSALQSVQKQNAQRLKDASSGLQVAQDAFVNAQQKATTDRAQAFKAQDQAFANSLAPQVDNLGDGIRDSIKDSSISFFSGIYKSISDGGKDLAKNVSDSLKNTLSKGFDLVISNAFNKAFSNQGSGGGGFLSNIFGKLLGGGSGGGSIGKTPATGIPGALASLGGKAGELLGGPVGIATVGLGAVTGLTSLVTGFFKRRKQKKREQQLKKERERLEAQIKDIEEKAKASDQALEDATEKFSDSKDGYYSNTIIGLSQSLKAGQELAQTLTKTIQEKSVQRDRAAELDRQLDFTSGFAEQDQAAKQLSQELTNQIKDLNSQAKSNAKELDEIRVSIGKSVFDFDQEVALSGVDKDLRSVGQSIADIINGGFDRLEAGFNAGQVKELVSNQLKDLEEEFIKPIDEAIQERLKSTLDSISDSLKDFGFERQLTADEQVSKLIKDFNNETLKLEQDRIKTSSFIQSESSRLLGVSLDKASAGGTQEFFKNISREIDIPDRNKENFVKAINGALGSALDDIARRLR